MLLMLGILLFSLPVIVLAIIVVGIVYFYRPAIPPLPEAPPSYPPPTAVKPKPAPKPAPAPAPKPVIEAPKPTGYQPRWDIRRRKTEEYAMYLWQKQFDSVA